MRLMAVAGRIEIKVTEKYLIERGILAKPYFVYHKIAYTRMRLVYERSSLQASELQSWDEHAVSESLSARYRLQYWT